MEYEFSRVEKLEPEGGRTWPLLTLGGLLVIAFAAASIYLIQSSASLQSRIERRAEWTLSLEEARSRLLDSGLRGKLSSDQERADFDKETVAAVIKVRASMAEFVEPDKAIATYLEHLNEGAFRVNAFLNENKTPGPLTRQRADLDKSIVKVVDELRILAAHETIELGGKWYLLNGLAALSIVLAALTLFLVRAAVLRGRKLQIALEMVQRIATKDDLTGLWNRRAIFPILHKELARCERDKEPLSVLMVDFDHFKKINDHHGHKAGDAVLR